MELSDWRDWWPSSTRNPISAGRKLFKTIVEGEESYGSRAHSVHHLRDSSSHLVFNPTNKTIGELRDDQPDDAELLEAMER